MVGIVYSSMRAQFSGSKPFWKLVVTVAFCADIVAVAIVSTVVLIVVIFSNDATDFAILADDVSAVCAADVIASVVGGVLMLL